MKLIHQPFIFTAAAVVWKEKDLIGTFKAVEPGRHDFSEIHFGANEVLVKKKKGHNVGGNVIMGHWYTSGEDAVIWEGKPGSDDQKARIDNLPSIHKTIHLEVLTIDTIIYHCTTFVRAKEPTDLDTLAMVRYGQYVASAKEPTIAQVVFNEGEVALVYKDKLNTPDKYGKWEVKTFTRDTVNGVLTDEKTQEKVKIHIVKESKASLKINDEPFTLKKP